MSAEQLAEKAAEAEDILTAIRGDEVGRFKALMERCGVTVKLPYSPEEGELYPGEEELYAETAYDDDERWHTPLHATVIAGAMNVLSYLLESAADVNAGDFKANTPLHLAANAGNSAVARLLLEGGAEAQKENFQGLSPLFYASNEEVARELIAHGGGVQDAAKAGLLLFFYKERYADERSRTGMRAVIRVVLKAGMPIDKNAWLYECLPINGNRAEEEYCADLLELVTEYAHDLSQFPYHEIFNNESLYKIVTEHPLILTHLVSKGAAPKRNDVERLLLLVCERGHEELLWMMFEKKWLEGALADSALMAAVLCDKTDAALCALKHGANPNHCVCSDSIMPCLSGVNIYYHAKSGTMKKLLSEHGAKGSVIMFLKKHLSAN